MGRLTLGTLVVVLAGTACFKPVGLAPGTNSTSGSTSAAAGAAGAAGGTTGASTVAGGATGGANTTTGTQGAGGAAGSAGTTSGAGGRGGTAGGATGTNVGNSGGNGAGSTGTTGGSACSAQDQDCPPGESCVLNVQHCPGPDGWASLSAGGVCEVYKQCRGGNCTGQPCASDKDCGLYETCVANATGTGSCEAFGCPAVVARCDTGCVTVARAHSCFPDCICPACPGSVDAGTGTADGGLAAECDLGVPCPAGEACHLNPIECSTPSPWGRGPFLSAGGSCEPVASCDGGTCYGQVCHSNGDCGLYEFCDQLDPSLDGHCQYVGCPDFFPGFCPDGCSYVDPPHSCDTTCFCPYCPAPDGGLPDLDGGPGPWLDGGAWLDGGVWFDGGTWMDGGPGPSLDGGPGPGVDGGVLLDGGGGPAGCFLRTPGTFCPANAYCDYDLVGCSISSVQTFQVVGGACRMDVPASGQPCASDDDCGRYEACDSTGQCSGVICPLNAIGACPGGCTWGEVPHSCGACLCDACPSSDGGP